MTTGKKITEFTQLSNIADQDVLLTIDVSDTTSSASGTTKKALFSAFKSNITSGLNISNWDTAYGWGNHATAGYQTDFTETDPVFSAHIASDITSADIGQWDAAYGWGNHAVQGYLQSIAAISIDALNDVAINSSTLAEDQVIKWNGTSWVNGTGGGGTTINGLNDVGDVTITLATLADNQILKYDSDSEKWRNENFADIALSSFSVITASASSTPSLSYNNENGVFTYTPPVISSFESDITSTDIEQWNTAYGWGNHAVQGYLQSIATISINALDDVDTTGVSTNDVLKWNGTSWVPGVGGGGGGSVATLNDVGNVTISSASTGQVLKWSGTAWTNQADAGGIALGDLSVSTASAGAASLSYDNTSGAFTYTPPDLSSVLTLGDLSVTTASAGTASLSYNNASGVFTYTPPDLSSIAINIVDDLSPQLGSDLSLNGKDISGTGDIDIDGDLKGDTVRLTNNSTTPGSGNRREIKVIGQLPHFYDGTDWRPFFLIDAPTQIPADTDWDNVMIRSTFDSDITDVKYNVTPAMVRGSSSPSTSIGTVSAPVKVGTKSLRINGGAQAQSRLQYPMTSDYDFTGAWTMEAWVNFDSTSWSTSPQSIFNGDGIGIQGEFALLARSNGGGFVFYSWYDSKNVNHSGSTGTDIGSQSDAIIVGAWAHVALVRASSDAKIRLYINGSQLGSNITDGDIANPEYFNIGGHYGQTNYDFTFDGYIDDVRISKSTRYTGNFTAPTAQLPISGSTTQLLPPQADKKGEIELDSTSPTFKGSPGVTMTRTGPGVYRLTFASSYSAADDYYVMAQGMDHSGGAASYITITRSTAHVDISVKKQSDDSALDDGNVGVQIINHT